MNNRHNYAYFSDLLRTHSDSTSGGIETRVSAADPAKYGLVSERDISNASEKDEWRSYSWDGE